MSDTVAFFGLHRGVVVGALVGPGLALFLLSLVRPDIVSDQVQVFVLGLVGSLLAFGLTSVAFLLLAPARIEREERAVAGERERSLAGERDAQVARAAALDADLHRHLDKSAARRAFNELIEAGNDLSQRLAVVSDGDAEYYVGSRETLESDYAAWRSRALEAIEQHCPEMRGLFLSDGGLPLQVWPPFEKDMWVYEIDNDLDRRLGRLGEIFGRM